MTFQDMKPAPLPCGWSKDALLGKAQRYAEEMLSLPRDNWRFAFWSTLVLELLARAALAHVNPVLLADPKDWNNLYHALGFDPKTNKYVPRSLDIAHVLSRLREILPDFDPGLEGFALSHMARRNEELHSGNTPFDGIRTSGWLPSFYRTCQVLLQSMGENLEILLGTGEAGLATTMIAAAQDETAKIVGKTIREHKTIFEGKSDEERLQLVNQASNWATRQSGHRVKCPACRSDALVAGEAVTAPIRSLEDDEITETQCYLPARFECVACGLKISGLSQLSACGLGDTYNATFTYDAAEYYAPDPYETREPEYEPDFND